MVGRWCGRQAALARSTTPGGAMSHGPGHPLPSHLLSPSHHVTPTLYSTPSPAHLQSMIPLSRPQPSSASRFCLNVKRHVVHWDAEACHGVHETAGCKAGHFFRGLSLCDGAGWGARHDPSHRCGGPGTLTLALPITAPLPTPPQRAPFHTSARAIHWTLTWPRACLQQHDGRGGWAWPTTLTPSEKN